MKYKFVREENNNWYIDLPEWPGDREDLQMVAGADTMLDILAQGEDEVNVEIITDLSETYNYHYPAKVRLKREMICADEYWQLDSQGCPSSGAFYSSRFHPPLSDMNIWLCNVTKFVFNGQFPEKIWIY